MAGKGSKNRSLSKKFKDNYSEINWGRNLQLTSVYRVSFKKTGDNIIRYAFMRNAKNEQDAINKFLSGNPSQGDIVIDCILFST